MFSHIPEEIFCPQVSGNITDALRVLKVTLEGPEKNARFFDLELSLVDPENPVTQISKTPSDEEFPWCGEDTEADVPSTTEEQELLTRPDPMVELVMENKEKDLESKEKSDTAGVVGEKDVQEDKLSAPNNKESNIGEEKTASEAKEQSELKIGDEQSGGKNEKSDEASKTTEGLEVPNTEEIDVTSEALSVVTPEEDPAEKEKREKEEKVMADYKNLAFPKRPTSQIKAELLVKDVKKFIEDMKKQTAPEDLDARLIPSNMACRFELPIDLTRLKDECPLSYLRKYCRVTDSRRTIYREKYELHKMDQTVKFMNLRKIYEKLYRVTGLQDEMMHLQRLLDLDLSMKLDEETFTVIACLMERIILKSQGRGTAQGYKKNIFEVTNFSALNGKLQDIEISPEMMTLLKYIRGT